MSTNAERANRAHEIIDCYDTDYCDGDAKKNLAGKPTGGFDYGTVASDLMCDILHWVNNMDMNADTFIEAVRESFNREVEDERGG